MSSTVEKHLLLCKKETMIECIIQIYKIDNISVSFKDFLELGFIYIEDMYEKDNQTFDIRS